MNLLTYTHNNRVITFEPLAELADGFIPCRYGCNSEYLQKSGVADMKFHKSHCTDATPEEQEAYEKLKYPMIVNPQHN